MLKKITMSFLATAFVAAAMLGTTLVPAHAQLSNPPGSGGDRVQSGLNDIGSAFPEGVKDNNVDIRSIVRKVINWALYLAAIVAVIFIIIGGYMYIFSAGDQTKAGKGRQTLVNALIGLTLIILSYLIVQVVYRFLTQPN